MDKQTKKEYLKKYYDENREILLLKSREYKLKNKDILRKKNIEYNRNNRDKIDLWRKENRESVLATYKRHYVRHRYDRQNNKVKAIAYLGNKCSMCGCEYDGTNGAIFDFHHLDPTIKESNVSHLLIMLDSTRIEEELNKCVLVCSNCHRQIHNDKY